MKAKQQHSWQVTTAEAQQIQLSLARQVSRRNELGEVRFVAGVDVSAERRGGRAKGAVVVLEYPKLEPVDASVIEQPITFPYIPGLLSFRETPLAIAAFERLHIDPDLVIVDGQGIAHPRRLGIASHIGLLLDVPAIGCAKSRLCGFHKAPGIEKGSYTDLIDNGEVIGAVLRSKTGVAPLYVSVGHKVDLETAVEWIFRCCRDYRLPEPTRLAHLAAAGTPIPSGPKPPTQPKSQQQMRLL